MNPPKHSDGGMGCAEEQLARVASGVLNMVRPRREVAVRPSSPVVVGSGSAGAFPLVSAGDSGTFACSRTNYRERLTAPSGRVLRRNCGAERPGCV